MQSRDTVTFISWAVLNKIHVMGIQSPTHCGAALTAWASELMHCETQSEYPSVISFIRPNHHTAAKCINVGHNAASISSSIAQCIFGFTCLPNEWQYWWVAEVTETADLPNQTEKETHWGCITEWNLYRSVSLKKDYIEVTLRTPPYN